MKKTVFLTTLLTLGAISIYAQEKAAECPMGHGSKNLSGAHGSTKSHSNEDWWPNKLNLQVLRQNSPSSNPMDANFNYRKAFNSLDYFAIKKGSLNAN